MSRVVLVVGGGIAAYKAPELVRTFVKAGHEVQVVTTEAATAFVSELSLATVSTRPVRRRLLDPDEEGRVGHIEIADWAELVVVAPATSDLLARAAAGMANDLATTVLLATVAPVLWVPAMNTNMWRHPATRASVATLHARGAHFAGPDAGDLACGWVGEGRMIDPPLVLEAAQAALSGLPRGPAPAPSEVAPVKPDSDTGASGPPMSPQAGDRPTWAGRRVVVSAGPTRAYVDPVRFLSNASTGAMGFEIAEAAARRGAEVVLVAGPVERPTPAGVRRIDVETGQQMLQAIDTTLREGSTDLVAMVAAVADLVPAAASKAKLDKDTILEQLGTMQWRNEVDVLATLVRRFGQEVRFLGFAAQTVTGDDTAEVEAQLLRYGTEKMARKGAHALFANRVGVPGTGFGSPTNAGYLLVARPASEPEVFASGAPVPKAQLAGWLLDQLESHVLSPGRVD